jgi:hypothetical protein
VRGAITLLIVGAVIATLGSAAVVLYVFRRRVRERFLLWFGLFSILYGISLVVRNSAFRLASDNRGVSDFPLSGSSLYQ